MGIFTKLGVCVALAGSIHANLNVPAGAKAGIDSVMEEFFDAATYMKLRSHGCWCSHVDSMLGYTGGHDSRDNLDELCKQWFKARNCNNAIGGCAGDQPDGYYMNMNAGLPDCTVSSSICETATCTIDGYYMQEITNEIDAMNNFAADVVGYSDCPSGNRGGLTCNEFTLPDYVPDIPEEEEEGTVLYNTCDDGSARILLQDTPKADWNIEKDEMISRQCDDCSGKHKFIVYKRLTNSGNIQFRDLMLGTWRSWPSNYLNRDFELYSSMDDAENGINRWTFCNYNDAGVGFPRDCGNAYWQWSATNFRGKSYHMNASKWIKYTKEEAASPKAQTPAETVSSAQSAASSAASPKAPTPAETASSAQSAASPKGKGKGKGTPQTASSVSSASSGKNKKQKKSKKPKKSKKSKKYGYGGGAYGK